MEKKIHYVHRFEEQCGVADLPPVSNPLLKTRVISVMKFTLLCVFLGKARTTPKISSLDVHQEQTLDKAVSRLR